MPFQILWSMGYHVNFRIVVLLVSRVGVTNLTTQITAAFCKSLIFNAFFACGSSPSSHSKINVKNQQLSDVLRIPGTRWGRS